MMLIKYIICKKQHNNVKIIRFIEKNGQNDTIVCKEENITIYKKELTIEIFLL